MTIDELAKEKGFVITPSNWVKLEGTFTPAELTLIAKEVQKKWNHVRNSTNNPKFKKNGNKN